MRHNTNSATSFYNASQTYYRQLKQHDAAYFQIYIELILAYSPSSTRTVLDLGCGTGAASHELARRGYSVVGMDISERFLQYARQASAGKRETDTPDVTYVTADVGQLPLKSHVFDVVASHDLLEHVPNAPRVLLEMIRVVKPDGLIVLKCPNLLSPWRPLCCLGKMLVGKGATPVWGESISQALALSVRNMASILAKRLDGGIHFCYRTPLYDQYPAINASDFDACYLAHPLDVRRFLKQQGFAAVSPHLSSLKRLNPSSALRALLPDWFSPILLIARRQEPHSHPGKPGATLIYGGQDTQCRD